MNLARRRMQGVFSALGHILLMGYVSLHIEEAPFAHYEITHYLRTTDIPF